MDVLPVLSLPIMPTAASAAARAELAIAQAIDFRPQDQSPEQNADRNSGQSQQDATYTPSGGSEPDEDGRQQSEMAAQARFSERPIDDAPSESTISLFA